MLYKCVLYNWTRFGHLVNFGSETVETKHVAGKICFGPLDSQIKGRKISFEAHNVESNLITCYQ